MSHNTLARVRAGALLAALTGLVGTGLLAQAPGDSAEPPAIEPGSEIIEVETDPIRCWWKADRLAIYIAEQFDVTLTCRIVEAATIRVVPHRVDLEPGTVQLTPFELVGGEIFQDIETPPWRYFQYAYHVRLMSDGFFGQDVEIPGLPVVYNIESVENEGTQGRDQTYVLPPLSLRVMSLVPPGADDIRDASTETFGAIEARRFRATQSFVVAVIFFVFAAALLGLALLRVYGHYRARVPVARKLPDRTVLGGCVAELARLKTDSTRDGWTPELAGRALSAFRLAGAVALGRPVAQAIAERDTLNREGQISVRTGWLGRRRAFVSGAATIGAIERRLAGTNGRRPDAGARAILEEIRDSLAVFNTVRYGRNGHPETTALDRALDNGTLVVRRLRWQKFWPTGLASAARAVPRVGGVEWSS